MKRSALRLAFIVTATLLMAGCDQAAQAGTSVTEQLQVFVTDFLRNVLAAFLI